MEKEGRFANIFAKSFWHELNFFLGKKSHGRVYCTDNLSVFLLLAVLRIKYTVYNIYSTVYIFLSPRGNIFRLSTFFFISFLIKYIPEKLRTASSFCYNLHCGVDPIEYYGGTYEKKTCHTLRENLTNLGTKIY